MRRIITTALLIAASTAALATTAAPAQAKPSNPSCAQAGADFHRYESALLKASDAAIDLIKKQTALTKQINIVQNDVDVLRAQEDPDYGQIESMEAMLAKLRDDADASRAETGEAVNVFYGKIREGNRRVRQFIRSQSDPFNGCPHSGKKSAWEAYRSFMTSVGETVQMVQAAMYDYDGED